MMEALLIKLEGERSKDEANGSGRGQADRQRSSCRSNRIQRSTARTSEGKSWHRRSRKRSMPLGTR